MKNLRKLRLERGLTQAAMADALKLTIGGYQAYEYERNQPSIETLKKISEILCVSIDYLVDNENANKPIADIDKLKKTLLEIIRELENVINEL